MNKRRFLFFAFSGFFLVHSTFAQDITTTETFSLQEIVRMARDRSIWALQAEVRKENRYWQYRVYRSNYNPQLSLNGMFPNFIRAYDPVRQNDGDYDYIEVNQNNSNINLFLSQSVSVTGTEFFINSNIKRFDNFPSDYKLYSGEPVSLGLRQPLFFYNELKWDKRIEPLRYEESKREFVEDLENISMIASNRFFDLLLAQMNFNIANINLANNDTIYKIGEGRYNLGKIAENELLDLELNVMTSRLQVAQSLLDMETSSLRLRTFVGLANIENFQLQLPNEIPAFEVDESNAINMARNNRADALGFTRRQLEAERDVAQAKGASGLNADLFASFGISGRSEETLPNMYTNTVDQQSVQIGFEIPIVDWGRQKSRVKTAQANLKLEEYTIELDEINFNEAIFTQVKQFKMLREQLVISERADFVAQKRYDIAKNRYLIGKISITDMNLALRDKDDAKRAYIQSLRDFWTAYYNLRLLTLYDFETNQLLYTPVEE
ncbi:MAG: TolC family protein [Cyclobacteriaceae bacterium]|nr:TolC family protein [Cyclobacteriaceae bacterium]